MPLDACSTPWAPVADPERVGDIERFGDIDRARIGDVERVGDIDRAQIGEIERAGDIEALRATLAARSPVDDRERASIERFLLELDRLASPFDEWADGVHVTGSALVVGARGLVLHRHKRLGIWLQPGGHVEPGEAVWDAARREAQEETGLAVMHPAGGPHLAHVDVHRGAKERCLLHLDVRYLLLGGEDDPCPPEGESPDARWFTLDEAVEVADPGLVGAVRALQLLA
jgi:8-oxo-dGTP pyrophosphatase MutT (NUDIX family)